MQKEEKQHETNIFGIRKGRLFGRLFLASLDLSSELILLFLSNGVFVSSSSLLYDAFIVSFFSVVHVKIVPLSVKIFVFFS